MSLLLTFSSNGYSALVTFDIESNVGGGDQIFTITSSGITLTLSNPLDVNGDVGQLTTDGDGLRIANFPSDFVHDFSFSFDAPVSVVSYEIGSILPGTVGSFDLLGPNGNSTGNALNPVGTFPINGSSTLLAGQTGTFDTTALSGTSPGSTLSELRSITVDDMPTAVPTPSAMLLMGSGLIGLVSWRWWSTKTS